MPHELVTSAPILGIAHGVTQLARNCLVFLGYTGWSGNTHAK